MKDLYYTGGPLFMSILSILLLIMFTWFVYTFLPFLRKEKSKSKKYFKEVDFIKSIGFFAMMVGILGQLIGMYGIFSSIQEVGDISIKILYGGLKVSMISTIYGIIIYLLSLIFWFTIKSFMHK